MGGPQDVNARPSEDDKPAEATKTPDRPQIDTAQALEERVELAKQMDESFTKDHRFTLGDGGFGIDGLEEANITPKAGPGGGGSAGAEAQKQAEKAPADAKLEGTKPAADLHSEPGSVDVDDRQRPKVIHYPDATTNAVEYDRDNKVSKITRSDGTVLEKQPDSSWTKSDGTHTEPLEVGGVKDIRDVRVTPEADMVFTGSNGSIRQNRDNSEVKTDAKGNVEVTAANGKQTTIEYENNTPKFIHLPDHESLTRKDDGTWESITPDGSKGPNYRDVQVSQDGTITRKLQDDSKEVRNTDGSIVTSNGNGDVTQVVYPDGRIANMKYELDATGKRQLVKIDGGKEGSYTKENGEWVLRKGDPPEETWRGKGSFHFEEDGTRDWMGSDGSVGILQHDGSSISAHTDQSTVTRDPHGRVTEIHHPNDPDGKATDITYDGDRPAEITDPDGSMWKREGSSWYQYKDGKPTGDIWSGDIEVNKDNGDIVRKNANGTDAVIQHRDGSTTDFGGDNPTETKDDHGHVTERIYPPGQGGEKETKYNYTDGKLTEAHTADGSIWKQTKDGKWQQYRTETEPVGPPQDIELRTTENGDCVISKNGEPVSIKHRDGSETEFKWDGSKVTKDKDGRTREIVNSDGSSKQYNADHSSVVRDAHEKVREVEYPSGDIRRIDYDDAGKPTEITDKNGRPVYKKDDRGVYQEGNSGIASKVADDVEVLPNGDIALVTREATREKREIVHPNGKHTQTDTPLPPP